MPLSENISIYANGVNIATGLNSFNPRTSVNEEDVSVLANDFRSFETGFKEASATGAGFFRYDMTLLDKLYNIQTDAFTNSTELVVTYSYGTLAVGGIAGLMTCCEQSFDIPMDVGAVIRTNLTLRSKNGLNIGKWLFNAAVDNTTTTGTAVDNAAATSNGGIFHAQVQNDDLADVTDAEVTLQHSVDNSVWVDLVAATAFTGTDYGAISVEVAAGTTVRRYLRAVVTTTGGAATVQAAFARR